MQVFQEMFTLESEQFAFLNCPCLYPAWAKVNDTHLTEHLTFPEVIQHHSLAIISDNLGHDATGQNTPQCIGGITLLKQYLSGTDRFAGGR